MSQDSMNTFQKLISISKQIGTYSLQNTLNIQGINSDINELSEISSKLHNEIIQIEKNSIKSIEILDKNRKILSNISNSILNLVANEIRKLSEETNAAIDETHNVTEESIKMIDIQENKNKEILNFYSKLSDMADEILGITKK